MPGLQFKGRVALVTGVGDGLGKEYALDLARRGAKVMVNNSGGMPDNSGAERASADAVVDEVKAEGGEAVANYDSVSSMEGGENMVKAAVDHFGKVDILINNAGIPRARGFTEMTEEDWDQVMTVYLKGAFCVTRSAVLAMKENHYGRIVLASSTSYRYGNYSQAHYGAAMMGRVGLMNELKLALSQYNIKVNTVIPMVDLRMNQGLIPEAFARKLEPKFNVPMVAYLCSEVNQETGMMFTVSTDWFARTAIVSGEGVCIRDIERGISAEEVRDHLENIREYALPIPDAMEIYSLGAPLINKAVNV